MLNGKYDWVPLADEHLETILEWRNDENVRRNMYTTHLITLEEHRAWFGRMQADDSRQYFVFRVDGEPQGVVGFSELNPQSRTAVWAFYANPQAPRGTGSQMEFRALEYFFYELGYYKLRCEVLGFNEPVVKLHKKFGFQQEGCIRHGHFDGEHYQDVVHLGMFEPEWAEQREGLARKLKVAL